MHGCSQWPGDSISGGKPSLEQGHHCPLFLWLCMAGTPPQQSISARPPLFLDPKKGRDLWDLLWGAATTGQLPHRRRSMLWQRLECSDLLPTPLLHHIWTWGKAPVCALWQLCRKKQNRFVLWYFAWRVMTGRHTSVTLNFVFPGHTILAPDWCLGLLKRKLRRSEVHSFWITCHKKSSLKV